MHQSSTLYVGLDVHKSLSPLPMSPKHTTPRWSPWATLGPANVISINSSVSCSPKVRISSLSMKPALAGIGSIAI